MLKLFSSAMTTSFRRGSTTRPEKALCGSRSVLTGFLFAISARAASLGRGLSGAVAAAPVPGCCCRAATRLALALAGIHSHISPSVSGRASQETSRSWPKVRVLAVPSWLPLERTSPVVAARKARTASSPTLRCEFDDRPLRGTITTSPFNSTGIPDFHSHSAPDCMRSRPFRSSSPSSGFHLRKAVLTAPLVAILTQEITGWAGPRLTIPF